MSIKTASESAPFWVQDNSVILRVLHRFIDCLDNNIAPKLFVKEKVLPELFTFGAAESPEELWRLVIDKLEHEHHIVEIKLNSKLGSTAQPYQNARLTFNNDTEETVRSWLDRPLAKSYAQQWAELRSKSGHKLPNPTAFVNPIRHVGMTASEVFQGFINIANELNSLQANNAQLSLRTLSSRCFNGNSKFLDKHRPFLKSAFPNSLALIKPRAIMMSVYVPSTIKAALFVENFDSFRSTVSALTHSKMKDKLVIVYSAGYRGSANLIRNSGHTQFVTINHASPADYKGFSDWWFSKQQHVPVYFWGDLDFEGLGILKALKARFNNAIAFKPAYEKTLKYFYEGIRHNPEQAGKAQQVDPMHTGCDYADSVLLPILRNNGLYVDQEVLSEEDILTILNHQLE